MRPGYRTVMMAAALGMLGVGQLWADEPQSIRQEMQDLQARLTVLETKLVEQARALIAKAYALLETRIGAQGWAVGDNFTLADCAAAPALFYAERIAPIGSDHPRLAAYLARLVARPSFARVLMEKEPWWPMFPFANG